MQFSAEDSVRRWRSGGKPGNTVQQAELRFEQVEQSINCFCCNVSAGELYKFCLAEQRAKCFSGVTGEQGFEQPLSGEACSRIRKSLLDFP
ncbi:MAG: hypothetical protein ACKPHU_09765, partial [Planctomycetaceae bacterium]